MSDLKIPKNKPTAPPIAKPFEITYRDEQNIPMSRPYKIPVARKSFK
jgi:hypothetical protein